jgi:hypothetical protein
MIDEISNELPEPFTVKELADAIIRRYGPVRHIDRQSLRTDILGCCVNMKSHGSLLELPLILVSLGGKGERRLLRRYNPVTDKHANLYLMSEGKTTRKHEGTKQITSSSGDVRAIYYNFNNAEKKLREKGLLSEIHQIIESVTKVDHREIQEAFGKKGWEKECRIHPAVNWAWDAYKDRIPVSIELSLIDAVHRDFLRLLLWEKLGRVDAMVYVTAIHSKEVKYMNVKRDLKIFSSLIKTPILLIGLRSV